MSLRGLTVYYMRSISQNLYSISHYYTVRNRKDVQQIDLNELKNYRDKLN